MNGTATRFLRIGVSLAGLVTLGWVLTGQAAKPVRLGLPTDWSNRHMIFSRPGDAKRAARVSADPRYWQQLRRRAQLLAMPVEASDTDQSFFSRVASVFSLRRRHEATTKNFKRDWSENMGTGASAGAGNYPAKFSFATNKAFCDANATPDYVVYSTGLAGSGSQASIVAYDNLYSGCPTGLVPVPNFYWSYNTGGQILTSPVLSLDGKQVAFVQTSGIAASLVILKWHKGDGTGGTPMTLTPLTALLWPGCTAPCMYEVPLTTDVGGLLNDTTSSAYEDYGNDVAWVGGNLGWLHKITGVFTGLPTEVVNGTFPLHVHPGTDLSSPVYDGATNSVFVSDSGGLLSRVDATSGAFVQSAQLEFSGRTTMGGPIVDSAAGLVYAFATDDGSGLCTNGGAVNCTGVFQFATNFAAASKGIEAVVGTNGSGFPNPLFMGGFDSAYFDSTIATPTGSLYVCGNTGSNATLYQIPITNGVMSTTSNVVTPLATAGSTAACSGVIDVPNPNNPPVPSERLFVSVQNDAVSTPCLSGGCILSFVSAPWTPATNFSIGQQVLSLNMHVETATTAGEGALLAANHPAWTTQIAATALDGAGGAVVWIDQGGLTDPFVTWIGTHSYAPLVKILDPNGNVQALTTASGTTGGTQPSWSTAPGSTTPDGTDVWTNVGALGTAALPVPGGTSGIIIDNVLGVNTVNGDSEVYFTTLSDQVCGTSGTGGCAVQASQTGLD